MGLFKTFFKNKSTPGPDNSRLLELLDVYWKTKSYDDYKNVYHELLNGSSFLLVPTKNAPITLPNKWTTTQNNATIKVSSVFNMDGLIVLGAFTDEQALQNWRKQPTEYTSMRSQAVLKFCEDNGVDRIVINTNEPNMYVLERNFGNVNNYQINKGTDVRIEIVKTPLDDFIVEKLINNFKKNNEILEVYQYGQTKENEYSVVLGFKLAVNSDNAKKAVVIGVQAAIQNHALPQPLDIIFFDTDQLYSLVSRNNSSLLYKRNI